MTMVRAVVVLLLAGLWLGPAAAFDTRSEAVRRFEAAHQQPTLARAVPGAEATDSRARASDRHLSIAVTTPEDWPAEGLRRANTALFWLLARHDAWGTWASARTDRQETTWPSAPVSRLPWGFVTAFPTTISIAINGRDGQQLRIERAVAEDDDWASRMDASWLVDGPLAGVSRVGAVAVVAWCDRVGWREGRMEFCFSAMPRFCQSTARDGRCPAR